MVRRAHDIPSARKRAVDSESAESHGGRRRRQALRSLFRGPPGACGADSDETFDDSPRLGGSYTTVLAFELPADVTHPRLLVTDEEPITRLLIGHEGSPGHKKMYFELG